ncbi:hypothetical protein D2T29_22390 [Sinirhodobacter populi]|uniref:Pyrroline-5-carboxylate reductase catalytic N-terminal domain-containing protein n=1 Tax=Paenirhodobacter populi TaxID=2306993 RepID=A0A443JX12_9RHOB|nr:NAD(P)-binding domain-containing protein [Sinirhodobacter populi]RWR25048.1 hypothetical protein D2T29_22390 [Sinirhodobacter populi]
MRIGIIGAGAIGSALAGGWSKAGHTVVMANSRGPETIREHARSLGAVAVDVAGALGAVQTVVVSIPFSHVPDLPKDLFAELPETTPVFDTCNYYPIRDGQIAALDEGKPDSVWVSEALGRPVVKVFNSILAHSLANKGLPHGSPDRIGLPVAGNEQGKAVAFKLVEDMGFTPVDGGTLDVSWRQQPGAPVYCTDLVAGDLAEALYRPSGICSG